MKVPTEHIIFIFIAAFNVLFISLTIIYVQGLKVKYFRYGIRQAYVHINERLKLGKFQDRKLQSLFKVLIKESMEESENGDK